jgi:hypothetical protein
MGPSFVEAGGASPYVSSGPDIYVSRVRDGSFGPAEAVAELNSAASDAQPNVRKDGREIAFASNRVAAAGQDLRVATRESVDDPWSAPVNLGAAVNTAANDPALALVRRDHPVLRPGPRPRGLDRHLRHHA